MNCIGLRASLLVLTLVLSSAAQSGTTGTTISCRSILLSGELTAGDHFEKAIGSGLVFRLDPEKFGPEGKIDGWTIAISPVGARNDDYIYPVNPPLRFNALQLLGPAYSEDTKSSLEHVHQMRFLISSADFDRIRPLLTNALWPYSAPHPDKADDEYVTALGKVVTGELKFVVQRYDAEPETGSIRHIKFQAEFTAPDSFAFDPALRTKTAACPAAPE